MNFDIDHSRDVIGNRIVVTVVTEGDQRVAQVMTDSDGFPIGDDSLAPPARQYRRSWRKHGSAGPGREHTVRVIATDQEGLQESAVEIWEDES